MKYRVIGDTEVSGAGNPHALFFSEFTDRPKSAQNFPQRSVGL
jgi:hypothetical protein